MLGNDALTVGVVDEIELSQGFFNYEEKYTLKTSAIHCPARIPEEAAARVQEAARKVYRALGCRGFARVDFLPPMGGWCSTRRTPSRALPHTAVTPAIRGVGLEFPALVTKLIELGFEA